MDFDKLARLIGVVETGLKTYDKAVGPFDPSDYEGWRQRQKAAMSKLSRTLQDHGAAFSDRGASGFTVRLGGLRSTSTIGWHAAVQNWLRAARAKARQAA